MTNNQQRAAHKPGSGRGDVLGVMDTELNEPPRNWWERPDDEQSTADARHLASGMATTMDHIPWHQPPTPGTGQMSGAPPRPGHWSRSSRERERANR